MVTALRSASIVSTVASAATVAPFATPDTFTFPTSADPAGNDPRTTVSSPLWSASTVVTVAFAATVAPFAGP